MSYKIQNRHITEAWRPKYGWNGYSSALRCPLPRNDAELEILSEAWFGKPAHAKKLSCYGSASYEILESHDSLEPRSTDGGEIDGQYDHARILWNAVFGNLSCGGVARASYGQTNLRGHRHKRRLEHWIKSRRDETPDTVRRPFARLALRLREGREQVDSR